MIGEADRRRLSDIVSYARKAARFLGTRDADALRSDEMALFAVIRAVEVVGEAAARVSDSLKAHATHLPWGPAKAMRNLLIHAYPEIDVAALVDTVRNDFPTLVADVERMLAAGDTIE